MSPGSRTVPIALVLGLVAACKGPQPATVPGTAAVGTPDHAELTRLCAEDQADRQPHQGPVDGKAIVARDAAREARVKEIYRAGELQTAKDYHHAALILQHAHEPEDYLLAHELCVVALAKGDLDARWLCAATEDRYLMSIDRPQRFATQFKADRPGEPMHLYKVDESVTDALRTELKVPTLARAKEREAQLNPAHHEEHP
jgi:hypothetical protein